jgi:hypothetical protein
MTVIRVSDTYQLAAAINAAVGGDTILLSGGNYGAGYIVNRSFSSAVTIKSASSVNKAHFDSLFLSGSSNLHLEGLDVGHALTPGGAEHVQVVRVQDSEDITLANMSIHGSLDGNPTNDALGLFVSNTIGFKITSSTFQDLGSGAYFERDTGVTISGNSFHTIMSDGLDFGSINDLLIDKNIFTDFHPTATDHADAIQFWLVGQPAGSSNINITNNIIFQGSGTGTQGIFIADGGRFSYDNINIHNNLIYGNDQYHGILVGDAKNVKIIGNTVTSSSSDNKMMWIDVYGVQNAVVKENITDRIMILGGSTGIQLSDNVDLSDTPELIALFKNIDAPGSAGDLIVSGYGYHALSPVAPAPATSASSPTFPTSSSSSSIAASASSAPSTSSVPVSGTAATMPVWAYAGVQVSSDVVPALKSSVSTLYHAVPQYGGGSHHQIFDHFAALP